MSSANSHRHQLMKLGISSDEAAVYLLLNSAGSLSAKEISDGSEIIVNSVYRLTKSLEKAGLVRTLESTPRKFQAVTPTVALSKLVDEKTIVLNSVGASLVKQLASGEARQATSMDILTGQDELFKDFAKRAKEAKNEILVISIGEDVPNPIWSAVDHSLSSGTKARFIFHQNTKENVMLVKKWQAIGVDVRHVPNEGYHLFIFDDSAAVMSASNPKSTKERTGVVIINKPLISAMKLYFEQQWSIGITAGRTTNL